LVDACDGSGLGGVHLDAVPGRALVPASLAVGARQVEVEATFALIQRHNWLLLALSVIALFGAVAGSHGLFILQ
jgi:hypothetical protein